MSMRRFRVGQAATSVSRKLHWKRALVAAMREVSDKTRQEVAVGSRHLYLP